MHLSTLMHRRRGFTLIELLVVVAIIALLIAILLPSLNLAKKQALQVVCNSRLKSHGSAAYLYAEDHKGWIVRGIESINDSNEYTIYARSVAPYLGYEADYIPPFDNLHNKELKDFFRDRILFQCPSFENPLSALDFVANASPIPYTQRNMDYDAGGQYNDDEWEAADATSTDYVSASKLDEIGVSATRTAADLSFVTEAHESMSDDELFKDQLRFMHYFLISQLPFGSNPRVSNDDRHPGGLNVLFFDGHATTMKHKKFDAGWPNPASIRGRFLTYVPAEIDD